MRHSHKKFLTGFIGSVFFSFCLTPAFAQSPKSLSHEDSVLLFRRMEDSVLLARRMDSVLIARRISERFNARKYIVPAAMIGYGFAAMHIDALTDLSESLHEETWDDHMHRLTTVENYLQFAPAVAVYVLNVAGIKGEHNFVDRSMILLMSNVIMEGFVSTTKSLTHELRPNGDGYLSFPSGHTAEAFVSATFLYEEYKNVSPWIGVGGFLVAGTVGALRIYNDKHWLHDVIAGAGFGIASTEFSYWLYPILKRSLFKKSSGNKMIVPVMENHGLGLAFIQHF